MIPPGGGQDQLQLVVAEDEFEMPNGLCFSPDESLLYINDTPRAHIKVFDVNADGTLANGRMFFEGVGTGVIEEGIPDGMKVDERGNVWTDDEKATSIPGVFAAGDAVERTGGRQVEADRRDVAHRLGREEDLDHRRRRLLRR